MNEQTPPVLSIGMIFKNDIRCIEHCLKALQPLRDAVPCELVMADTGSEDGSREIAEKYADVLFDFPWIDDFAAARNAVLDRCTGAWFLSVDTDEYLESAEELTAFLMSPRPERLCRVVIRNYTNYELEGIYADFFTLRLVHRSLGARYEGAIHEHWDLTESHGGLVHLSQTVFKHDGYVKMDQNRAKLDRNMTLLRKELQAHPESLRTRMQAVESGGMEPDYVELVRKSVTLLKRKPENWKEFGPPILRKAVACAHSKNLPELDKWVEMAHAWFPDSYFTRLDVNTHCLFRAYEKNDYAEAVRLGEDLMAAYDDYFAGRGDLGCQAYSTLNTASPTSERTARLLISNAYIEEKQPEKALALLEGIDYTQLNNQQTEQAVKTLCILQGKCLLNTTSLARKAWDGITSPVPNENRAEERRRIFMSFGSVTFTANYRRTDVKEGRRSAYTLFLPLVEDCGLGIAARVLESQDPAEMAEALGRVEKWNELPYPAVGHAIAAGMVFPLPDHPLYLEEMDVLAGQMTAEPETLRSFVTRYMEGGFADSWQTLNWTRALVLAAVQRCAWQEGDFALARAFAEVEGIFLPASYTPEALKDLHSLPPMHRFGLYCSQAFSVLATGDTLGYVRFLRMGLDTCSEMKPMVEFLLEHTPELRGTAPSQELLDLAEKVRAMLSAYPADDPSVAALKASPVYQKVAHLIEAG